MRRKVRGLRKIERAVLERQSAEASENLAENDPEATLTVLVGPVSSPATEADEESTIEEATTDPAGRVGTAISGNAEILARCRFVVEFRLPAIWSGSWQPDAPASVPTNQSLGWRATLAGAF
jgi:hypothetical protein